jgi:putative restriction endonuclease
VARTFGEIPGQPEGTSYADRRSATPVHKPLEHGISGGGKEGSDSIVVSGGYEDDEDYGDLIVYTGFGGRDRATGAQIADQKLEAQNLALALTSTDGLPVRVVRGYRGDPAFSPTGGYRYDGLFAVTSFWHERGRSGFLVWRYELRKLRSDGSLAPVPTAARPPGPAPRTKTTTERIVRITEVGRRVKALHRHRCQVCGESVATPAGPYAEASHVRPLGRPHNGPDTEANVLCLCPNDHVRFDTGAIMVAADLRVVDAATGSVLGRLRTVAGHSIDPAHLEYHRERFGTATT